MELILQRQPSSLGATLGTLAIDGEHECHTLEDAVRPAGPKVPGQTAIPAGRYRVALTPSRRFGRILPLLLEVPGFAGVRIHAGNTDADTAGCILVGCGVAYQKPALVHSRIALDALLVVLEARARSGDEVWIRIQDAPDGAGGA
jgi:hypothetical protein